MRTGHRRSAPVFRTVEEKREHVAQGHGIVCCPVHPRSSTTRPGVAHSHVSGHPAESGVLAWEGHPAHRLIRDFAAIDTDHRPSPGPPGCLSQNEATRRVVISRAYHKSCLLERSGGGQRLFPGFLGNAREPILQDEKSFGAYELPAVACRLEGCGPEERQATVGRRR